MRRNAALFEIRDITIDFKGEGYVQDVCWELRPDPAILAAEGYGDYIEENEGVEGGDEGQLLPGIANM